MTEISSSTASGLSGRFAIVTGAGSGIGRAIAITLANAGATVAAIDLTEDSSAGTVAEIEHAGGKAEAIGTDITDEQAVEALVQDLSARWGRIDILCNNAGIADPMTPPAKLSTETWNRVIGVNLTGQFFMTRAVLQTMLPQKYGVILNTASPAGLRGAVGGFAYTASKHAMVGFTKHLAWFYARDGIRCNAVCPGSTVTGIDRGLGLGAFDPEGLERLMPVMATSGPSADPQTVANVVLFLASDAAAHVNGIVMPVDGGWMAG